MNGKEKQQLKAWEHEKEVLILRYMQMQDEADALNARIFDVCAQIEILNKKISIARGDPPESTSESPSETESESL